MKSKTGKKRRRCLWAAALFFVGCDGANPSHPPKITEVTKNRTGELDGWTPNGFIANEFHQKNQGGSDGLGLCVYAASKAVMSSLGWTEAGDKLWEYAKVRPGGSYPDKWKHDAAAAIPDVPYVSLVGTDFSVQKRLSDAGLPWAGTMGRDPDIYGNKDVAHYVSWEHWDDHLAVYTDNNLPGVHTFIPAKEAERRALAGTNGQYWITAFGRLNALAADSGGAVLASVVIIGIAVLAFAVPIRRSEETDEEGVTSYAGGF